MFAKTSSTKSYTTTTTMKLAEESFRQTFFGTQLTESDEGEEVTLLLNPARPLTETEIAWFIENTSPVYRRGRTMWFQYAEADDHLTYPHWNGRGEEPSLPYCIGPLLIIARSNPTAEVIRQHQREEEEEERQRLEEEVLKMEDERREEEARHLKEHPWGIPGIPGSCCWKSHPFQHTRCGNLKCSRGKKNRRQEQGLGKVTRQEQGLTSMISSIPEGVRKILLACVTAGDCYSVFQKFLSGNIITNTLVGVLSCLVGLLRCTEVAQAIAFTVSLLAHLNCVDTCMQSLITAVKSLFTPVQQAYGDFTKYATAVFSVLLTLTSIIFTGAAPSGKGLETFLSRFSQIGRSISSLEAIFTHGSPILRGLYDYVREHIFKLPSFAPFAEFEKFMSDVHAMCTIEFEQSLPNDDEKIAQVEGLYIQGLSLTKSLTQLGSPRDIKEAFSPYFAQVLRLRNLAAKYNGSSYRPRVVPVVFHLFGPTGVGKSTVTWSLCARLLAEMGATDPNDLYTRVYFRQTGQEFWDGYDQRHKIVVYDDVGSLVDSVAKPNEEFLEAIRTANIAPYHTHQASLEKKDNSPFRSEVVLWTSNRSKFDTPSLTNPEAVTRRIDMKLRVRVRPEFRSHGSESVDETKVAHLTEGEMRSIYTFDVVDKNSPNDHALETGLSLDDILERMVSLYKFRKNASQQTIRNAKKYMQDCITKVQTEEVVQEMLAQVVEEASPIHQEQGHWSNQEPVWRPSFHGRNGLVEFLRQHKPALLAKLQPLDQGKSVVLSRSDLILLGCAPPTEIVFTEYSDRHQELLDLKHFNITSWEDACFIPVLSALVASEDYLEIATILQLEDIPSHIFEVPQPHKLIPPSPSFIKRLIEWVSNKAQANWVASMTQKAKEVWGSLVKPVVDFVFNHPIAVFISLCATLLGVVAWFRRPKALPTCLTRVLSNTEVRAEAYSGGSTRAHSRKTVEAYSGGATAARSRKNVEGYNGGATKSQPRHATEAYNGGSTRGVIRATIEGQVREEQAAFDQNTQDLCTTLLARNIYKVESSATPSGPWTPRVNGTFISGTCFLVNNHLNRLIKNHLYLRISNASNPDGFVVSKNDYKVYVPRSTLHLERDVCIFAFRLGAVAPHRNIVRHFQTGEDFSQYKMIDSAVLVGYGAARIAKMSYTRNVRAHDAPLEVQDHDGIVHTHSRRVYFDYAINTQNGDCGMLLLIQNVHFNRKIVAMHSSGLASSAYPGSGIPISQATLNDMLQQVPGYEPVPTPEVALPLQQGKVVEVESEASHPAERVFHAILEKSIVGNIVSQGVVADPPFAPSKTNIYPSPIFGTLVEPTTAPAVLKPTGGVDPLEKAYKKVTGPPTSTVAAEKHIEAAINEVFMMFDKNVEGTPRTLTYDEAVEGIEGEDFIDALSRKSSAGYPWKVAPGKPGKSTWFGQEGPFLEAPEVRAAVSARIQQSANRQRPLTLWTDTLKDERRDLERVNLCKTRMFSAGDMAFNIHFRMYFLSFFQHLMKNRIDNGSCVGINPMGHEWTKLVNRLRRVQDARNIVAGDFSNYDGTLSADIVWRIARHICSWYSVHDTSSSVQEDNNQRMMLFYEIVHSMHLTKGQVFQWNQSQPSGNPGTALINTVYNLVVMRVAWRLTLQHYIELSKACSVYSTLDSHGRTCFTLDAQAEGAKQVTTLDLMNLTSRFDDFVSMVAYGDDNLLSVDNRAGWFSQEMMTFALRQIGMEYTDDEKHGTSDFRSLTEVHFLKRGFYFNHEYGRWFAPLKLSTVLEMTNWVHGKADQDSSCALNLETSARELTLHPEEVYDFWMPRYRQAAGKLASRCTFLTYDEAQALWETGHSMW